MAERRGGGEASGPTQDAASARLSRRRLLQIAGGGVVATAGAAALYARLAAGAPAVQRDVPAGAPVGGPPRGGYPVGQYQVADYGVRVQIDADSGIEVIIPPRWNLVITTRLTRPPTLSDQQRLEAALRSVEAAYSYSPTGIFALVAYGLPYFRAHTRPEVFAAHLPNMADAQAAPVVLDAIRFASDPPSTLLEANDVAFHLRSDVLAQLHDVRQALFGHSGTLRGHPAPAADISDLFEVTSVRTGFIGAGLPRLMAQQAHLGVADKIPADTPLFMGFTSTQQLGQAHEVAVRFDGRPDPLVRPLTTAKPGDYFAGGTALAVSHLVEDLESWYALSYEERAARMFHYDVPAPPGRITVQTLWLNPNTTTIDAQQRQVIGHNEAVQRGSRTLEGQALQLRVDFNTLDALDTAGPRTGVHFLSFSPGSQVFQQSRQGMDATDVAGAYQIAPKANGINAFIRATRRQNFLVPPRAHRAFPLLELSAG